MNVFNTAGLFDNPVLLAPEGFDLATQRALSTSDSLVNEITEKADYPDISVIQKMDELSNTLCNVADLAECIRQVHPDSKMVQKAQDACMSIGNYVEELNTNPYLYNAVRKLISDEQFQSHDDVTKRTAETFLHDFEISGIHLETSKREKVVKLNNQILELSYHFHHNTSVPSLVRKDVCPPVLTGKFAENNGYIHIDHIPLSSPSSSVRAVSYMIYYGRNAEQEKLLENLLLARQELATLVGYPTFAHRVLKSSMAGDPNTVLEFLEQLNRKILPLAQTEANEMVQLKQAITPEQTDPDVLRPWDLSIAMAEGRKQSNLVHSKESETYFSLSDCMGGLNNLFQSLFGIKLESIPFKEGEVWDPHVRKIAFVHAEEGVIGYTYGDFFARPGKLASDCHFTIRGGCELPSGNNGSLYQLPVIALCCNFDNSFRQEVNSLSQHSVENFYHEMGHALHSMLGRSKYQNVTGTRCSTDFAEVPSILMEFFLSDSRVLSSFAKHYKTRQPIPASHIESFQLSNHFFPAYELQTQILYAVMDQSFHSQPLEKDQSIVDRYAKLHAQYSPTDYVEGTAWFLRFNHFYSYAAKYYSYLWSRAVASLIWKSCFAEDPFSRESGGKFREMLRHGGGIHPMILVKNILGYEPSILDLVNALHDDVIERQSRIRVLKKY